MVQAYSPALRSRVLKAAADGMSARQAAARFGVCISTAIVWVRRYRQSGEAVARRRGKLRDSRLDAHEGFIVGLVDAGTKDISLAEIAERSSTERSLSVGITSVWTFLNRHGLMFKKKTAHATEQQREDVREARQAWFDGQLDLDPEKLIFIDATGASPKMARLRGSAKRGERCGATVPHGHMWTSDNRGRRSSRR